MSGLDINASEIVGRTASSDLDGLTVSQVLTLLSLFANAITTQDSKVGFYGTAPISKPTGVAVSAAGIHAALVSLGLIAA